MQASVKEREGKDGTGSGSKRHWPSLLVGRRKGESGKERKRKEKKEGRLGRPGAVAIELARPMQRRKKERREGWSFRPRSLFGLGFSLLDQSLQFVGYFSKFLNS